MLGGSYDFKVVKLFATYGQSKNDVSDAKLKTATVGASVPIGAGKILAGYARTRNSLLDATRQTLTLGYGYDLSKRTDLYANVMHDRITDRSNGTSFGVGIRHRF
jgi:predicted porin